MMSPEGLARMREAVIESNKRRGEQDPNVRRAKALFAKHRSNAKIRGVAFLLTFDEWWSVWDASGRWSQRGSKAGQYCMSRYGDSGAYERGNVFINLSSSNVSEGVRGLKRTAAQNAERARWMKGNKNSVGRKWINNGIYATCLSAEKADEVLAGDAGWKRGRRLS